MAVRARQRVLSAEVAFAFLVGVATFALVAVTVAAIEIDVPVLLLAVVLAGAVVAVARRLGVAYAVPVAMASVLAYDWYYLPPIHDEEIPDHEPDDTVSVVASWNPAGTPIPAGTRASLAGKSVAALVQRTGRPARLDSYDDASGSITDMLRDLGIRCSVGAPIVVDGRRTWGVTVASSKHQEPLARVAA